MIIDAQGGGTLEFGEGIDAADVRVSRSGYDLILGVGAETITISGWFSDLDTESRRYSVHFADETVWSGEYLHETA